MGISLRHHVLTLVGIFLMLLVGLLVGFGLAKQPGLEPRLEKQIGDLAQRVDYMTEHLERDARTQEDFARASLPRLVGRRLEGRRIALVVTARPEDSSVAQTASEALEAAGASVPYRVICRRDFIERALADSGAQSEEAGASEAAATELAQCLLRGDPDALTTLKKRGLIRVKGKLVNGAPDAVVLIGGAGEGLEAEADFIDRPLVAGLQAGGVRSIVGCEDLAPVTYMDVYRELDISTVDNVGLARGQVSLVLALSGRPGNYGDGPSAEEEFPTLE